MILPLYVIMCLYIPSSMDKSMVSINRASVISLCDALVASDTEWRDAVLRLVSTLSEEHLYQNGDGYIIPSMLSTSDTIIYCIRKTLKDHDILVHK